MTVWDTIAGICSDAGTSAKKAKVRGDMMMIDREITNLQKAFGVEMYDHFSPLTENDSFYADNDDMTDMMRPLLITAQKDVSAVSGDREKVRGNLDASVTKREEMVGQNFTKLGMHKSEAIMKAKLSLQDRKINGYKGDFGLKLFAAMKEAEEDRGFTPTDAFTLKVYTKLNNDIEKQMVKKRAKEQNLIQLGEEWTRDIKKSSYTPPAPAPNTTDVDIVQVGDHDFR